MFFGAFFLFKYFCLFVLGWDLDVVFLLVFL